MTPHVQEAVKNGGEALAPVIEPHARAAWPARETLAHMGWLCRFTAGHSHRANSVAALDFPHDADLGAAIAFAEAAYRARGLAPMFHITPVARPPGLERVLLARGYDAVCPTLVMTADLADVAARAGPAGEAALVDRADPEMAELVIEGSHSAADGKERLEILARVPAPHACMLARDKGRAASSGLAVRGGDWAGFFLMRTNSQMRRRGHARRVLAALAGWACAHGARRAYLQVEEANQPARALYERTGFRNAYAYRFLRTR